jgi:hypothetical protein
LTYTPFIQINFNTKDNTLIGENPAVREEIEIKIKYAEEHRNFWRNIQKIVGKYYNKKYKKIAFTLSDEILLNTKNFTMRKLYKKFLNRYIESFQILKKNWNEYLLTEFI